MTHIRALPAPPVRLSPRLRETIRLRVEKGLTVQEACERAGFSRAGYHKAMKRPAVRDFWAETQAAFIAGTDQLRAQAKRLAIETALDLMQNSKSEAIRARMAEFLAADAKVSPVAVHIDARATSGAYEYARPGQQVVEISSDTTGRRLVDLTDAPVRDGTSIGERSDHRPV